MTQSALTAAAEPSLASESASEPTRVGISVDAKPMWRGLAPAADESVTVVVHLQGDSVAEVRSQSTDLEVSETTRETIVNDLRRQQDGLRSMIEAYGGEVEATFQHAVNGIKVRIPASKLGFLTGLPGMVAIRNVAVYEMTNTQSVPYIGAPAVWQGPPGFHGEGIKVAIIDTGLDYTHANFAGPGTPAAYTAAHAAETAPANPALFGPAAPKVKGGTDLVGDAYNASARKPDGTVDTAARTPHPDANPLDCNGHGSHVGGTTAGFGVTSAGATYTGPYDSTTPGQSFRIGPGVAPKADLYAVRVFGCQGSTNVVVEAIDWAVEHHMQVVNMSLGSDWGTDQSADAVASTNAEKAGVIIVASAGNAGRTVPYIVGSPSTGDRTLSIAAVDSKQTFPGAIVTLTPAATQTWQNSNDGALPTHSLPVQTLRNAPVPPATTGKVSLGCLESEYMDPADGSSKVAGKLVVAIRGTCARIYRAQAAFAHSAASAALINNAAGYPSFEGDIMSCIKGVTPDNLNGRPCEQQVPANGVCARGTLTGTGKDARCVEEPELVTFAFFGVLGATPTNTDGATLANSTSADTFTATRVTNPTANQIIGFSSSGPRSGYDADGFFSPSGHLKPDLAAPGVSILSTAVGTGNGGEVLSGTSMAAPHVSGVTALALQSHPNWPIDRVRLAIANTASPTKVTGWSPRQAGAGLVQPLAVTRTRVVARGDTGDESNLSFGAVDFLSDFTDTRSLFVTNLGSQPVTFNASTVPFAGIANRAHTATVTPSTFTLAKGKAIRLQVSLTVPAATAGSAAAFREVGGYVSLTPAAGTNGDAALAVPYYFVPRARSDVSVAVQRPFDQRHPTTTATVKNSSASVTGLADVYSWGAVGHANKGAHGIRALGVKTGPCTVATCGTDNDRIVTFAVNTFRPNSQYAAATIEYDVDITLAGNTTGTSDFTLFTADLGLIQNAAADGRVVTVLVNNKTKDAFLEFIATAPTDGSLVLMPMLAGDAGIKASAARFTYTATAFFNPDDRSNPTALITDTTGAATFNAYTPSLSATTASGPFPTTVVPAETKVVNLTIDPVEWAKTPTRGVMVVARENANSARQALLSRIGSNDDDDDEGHEHDREDRAVVSRR
jgi:subtilisin family serine protease